MAEPTSQVRRLLAEALAKERKLALVPPYDHQGVIAGQSARLSSMFIPTCII